MGNFVKVTILGIIVTIALAVAYWFTGLLLGVMYDFFPADGAFGILALVLSWVIVGFVTGVVILLVVRRFH